jgi:hypothetical protein
MLNIEKQHANNMKEIQKRKAYHCLRFLNRKSKIKNQKSQ